MAAASTNAAYRAAVEREVADTARALLEGRLSVTEASRILTRCALELGTHNDPVFIGFRGIDSETDTFPLGAVRDGWNPAALAREDLARERYEEQVRASALEDCSVLVARYGGVV